MEKEVNLQNVLIPHLQSYLLILLQERSTKNATSIEEPLLLFAFIIKSCHNQFIRENKRFIA